jgi:HlyD family secretion protein
MKKNKRKQIVFAILILIMIVIIGVAYVMKTRNDTQKTIEVPLVTVTQGPLRDKVSASGSFQAERYSVVASQTYGIVKKVYVKPGDHVEKGDIIVVVDEREARESLASAEIALEEIRRSISAQLSSLRAEVRTATVTLAQANRAMKNAESLKAVDGISLEDFRKANEAVIQAQSTLDDANDRLRVAEGIDPGKNPSLDAKKELEVISSSPAYLKAKLSVVSAQRVLDGCVFHADIAGTVTEMNVAQGARLTEETIVARIEDPQSVKAEVNVDEVDIGKIREGMKVEVTSDSMLGDTINGKVIRIWPIVKTNGNGRVCLVRIAFDQFNGQIISGASCMARIMSTVRENTLTIPATALIPGNATPAVWLAVEQLSGQSSSKDSALKTYKATRKEIKLGASTVSTLEVLSGLAPSLISFRVAL